MNKFTFVNLWKFNDLREKNGLFQLFRFIHIYIYLNIGNSITQIYIGDSTTQLLWGLFLVPGGNPSWQTSIIRMCYICFSWLIGKSNFQWCYFHNLGWCKVFFQDEEIWKHFQDLMLDAGRSSWTLVNQCVLFWQESRIQLCMCLGSNCIDMCAVAWIKVTSSSFGSKTNSVCIISISSMSFFCIEIRMQDEHCRNYSIWNRPNL